MKKNLYILIPTFGLSAVLLAACGSEKPQDFVTQPITSTQESLEAGASSSSVTIAENKDDGASIPAAGESVPIAANTAGPNSDAVAQGSYISEADAKNIALEHAGIKEEDITYFKLKLDTDDGIVEYEVKFYASNTEYDYDIDAVTGAIRSFDTKLDQEHHQNAPAGSSNTAAPDGAISEDDAKKTALEQVPGATESNLRLKTDYDDGRMKYEIKIVYNEIKYDFDIDAATGKILEWESESIYD